MPVASAEQFHLLQSAEKALRDATYCRNDDERQAALQIFSDSELFELWKADMRQLLKRAAQARSLPEKQSELRRIGTCLIHQSALIDHLQRSSITGKQRNILLESFFSGIDCESALLHEQRRFELAAAGRIALDRLLLLQHDYDGGELLVGYKAKYARYFALYCNWLALRQGAYSEIVRSAMLEAQRAADEWRRLTLTTRLPRPAKRRFPWPGRGRLPVVTKLKRHSGAASRH